MKIHNKTLYFTRKLLLILLFSSLFINCSIKEKPEFVSVKNIAVTDSNSQSITLKADALFKNPNAISGKLWTDKIKVFVNSNEMAIVLSEAFDVPSKAEFTIPLVAKIATKELISDKNLSGLLSSLFSQKLEIQYKGDIEYKVFGFSHKYSLDKTETVKIKL